jgi:hypothetical protein
MGHVTFLGENALQRAEVIKATLLAKGLTR